MKSYGQFCGLARALDHVGDRWTLLVVRELLLRPARYGELLASLDGVPTNLLAERLRVLEADGLVTREPDPSDGRRVTYRLTTLGQQLEPALLALIRWGAHWMAAGRGADRFEPAWAALALRALLADRRAEVAGTIELRTADMALTVAGSRRAGLRVELGAAPRAAASVEADGEVLLGLVSGVLTWEEAMARGLHIDGDRDLARALLSPRPAQVVGAAP